MRLVFLFVGAFAIFITPSNIQAAPEGKCAKARNTVDMLSCVKKKYEAQQTTLNKMYEELLRQQSGESDQLEQFKNVQKDWVNYRDEECALKTDLAENESLRRLEQLTCLSDLTENRIGVLASYNDSDVNMSGFEAAPRWMNAMANDFPKTFWAYTAHVQADLDCDGRNEEIVPGVKISKKKVETDEGQSAERFEPRPVFAIVENPPAGRPKTRLVEYTSLFSAEDGQEAVCDPALKLRPEQFKREEAADSVELAAEAMGENARSCETAISVSDKICGEALVFASEEGFEVIKLEN